MEITNYKKMPEGNYEHSIFDVYLGNNWGICLKGFCLCKSKTGNFYIKSSSFKDKRISEGVPFVQAVDMVSERGKEFCKAILKLLQPFIEKEGSSNVDDPQMEERSASF